MAASVLRFDQEDLYDLARGACLLASGGGGTLESGMSLARNFVKNDYYDNPVVEVVPLRKACSTGGWAVVTAYLGAPQAIKTAQYPLGAVAAVSAIKNRLEQMGHKLEYVVPVETGALSSLVPCLVAAKMGLKVIDADGAGRAVPELPMLTFGARGVSANPAILANAKGLDIALNVDEAGTPGGRDSQEQAAAIIEKIARPVVGIEEFNQIAGLAMWVMNAQDMAKAMPIIGTLSMAHKLGREIPKNDADGIIQYLKQTCGLKVFKLFEGTLSDAGVSSVTGGGFDHGLIRLNQTGSPTQCTAIFQNETLIAWSSESDQPLAMAPDSIAYFLHNDQRVYSNGDIVTPAGKLADGLNGVKVTVIGIAAHAALRESEASLIGSELFQKSSKQGAIMRSFQKALLALGYAGKYVKIEDLHGNTRGL